MSIIQVAMLFPCPSVLMCPMTIYRNSEGQELDACLFSFYELHIITVTHCITLYLEANSEEITWSMFIPD